jgi:hypothetical protein
MNATPRAIQDFLTLSPLSCELPGPFGLQRGFSFRQKPLGIHAVHNGL